MSQHFIVYPFVSERKRQVVIEQTQFLRTKEAWLILQSEIDISDIFFTNISEGTAFLLQGLP